MLDERNDNMSMRAGTFVAAVVAASLLLSGCGAPPTADPSGTPSSAAPGTVAIDELLQLGIASAQAGDVDQAAATFENVLALDPGNAFASYNLGVLAQQSGDTDAALAHYDAAIERDPVFTSAMYNKAIILEATDPAAAAELYRAIVAIDDQAATAYFRLSLLLEAQGDTAGATEARDRALALDPTLADAETDE